MSPPVQHPADPVAAAAGRVETRSIDVVPEEERHGTLSSIGSVWFIANLPALGTGAVAVTVGGPLLWTLVAVVVGSLLGTVPMALLSSQGPRLGLPQLVRSRAQFGYAGAAVSVFVVVFVNYAAYATGNALQLGAAARLLGGPDPALVWPVAIGAAAAVAVFGHDLIHRVNRVLVVPVTLLTVLLTAAVVARGGLGAAVLDPGGFELAPFVTVVVMTGGFQLCWSPYVSDYSRYLPSATSRRALFWWTYAPSALSAVWVFTLGGLAQAATGAGTPVEAVHAVGGAFLPGFGAAAVVLQVVCLAAVMSINLYGGGLTVLSVVDSLRPLAVTRAHRVVAVAATAAVVWAGAGLVGPDRFYAFYSSALVYLAYAFTPWAAITLVDCFLLRRGHYDVADLADPSGGRYGRWGVRGNTAYLLALVAMVPFVATPRFTGPAARALSGVDGSIAVGLVVAGAAYWVLARRGAGTGAAAGSGAGGPGLGARRPQDPSACLNRCSVHVVEGGAHGHGRV